MCAIYIDLVGCDFLIYLSLSLESRIYKQRSHQLFQAQLRQARSKSARLSGTIVSSMQHASALQTRRAARQRHVGAYRPRLQVRSGRGKLFFMC